MDLPVSGCVTVKMVGHVIRRVGVYVLKVGKDKTVVLVSFNIMPPFCTFFRLTLLNIVTVV